MPIVSISLNDQILADLDKYQRSLGFSGRSEIIRAGIRTFISKEKQKASLSGQVNALLCVVHDDDFDGIASGLSSKHEHIITTQMHNKIDGKKCMDVFVMKGAAEEVTKMVKKYDTNKYMETIEMIVF